MKSRFRKSFGFGDVSVNALSFFGMIEDEKIHGKFQHSSQAC
jgi:hypothetical protein